jgi:diamine N-acetyltransferase
LFAYIAVENLPSRRLFAACGYKESAVLKEWAHTFGGGYTDVLVVQKLNLS